MQLNTMDCTGRSNLNERDSELGDDMTNDWFDIMNSRVPRQDTRERLHAYGLSLELQNETLNNMSQMMLDIRAIGRNTLLPFQKGIIQSNNALKMLHEELKNHYNIEYVLTYRLNQDVLENFFGIIRSKGGLHDHPDRQEFKHRLRSYILGYNEGILGTNANVEVDNTPDLEDVNYSLTAKILKSIHPSIEKDVLPKENYEEELENLNFDGLENLAGYICHKLKNEDLSLAAKPLEDTTHSWVRHLNEGGLSIPSNSLMDTLKSCDEVFVKLNGDKLLATKGYLEKHLVEAKNIKASEDSHDDHSDDEMRECDSVEEDHISRIGSRLNTSITSNNAVTAGDINGSDHINDIAMSSHHHQFPPNHPLNALGNFMGIGGLHGIPNLQHNDVLEKLKMQVRDMKVGLMDQEYAAAHAAAFGSSVLPNSINSAFTLPPSTMASFTHAAQTLAVQAGNNMNSHLNPNTSTGSMGSSSVPNGSHNTFSFTSPTAPSTKDVNPASNSSTSSETSNSSQQNNSWSFEEQYKQVRQLYEINDDPKRKEFLDDLFSFMQKRGTPINRLPIMAKSVLDLYELYNLVIARGGLVDVINKKLWQEIIKGLHLPSSITSAAFTLRTQYMKYLYPYECEKKNLSTPAELQAAIDGNRREGRRSSYGQYEAMHSQMQMPQITRQSLTGGIQQMSPLALVTHAAAANNQQAQAAVAAAAAHHRLMKPPFVPNLVTQEIEQRMIEYLKLMQVKKEQNVMNNGSSTMGLSPHQQHNHQQTQHQQQHQQQQHQQQHQRSQSPEIITKELMEMSRVALWQHLYQNNTSPEPSISTSPHGGGNVNFSANRSITANETQRSEALNLSDSPPNLTTIKRERGQEPSPEIAERDEFHHQQPPAKRASYYLPSGMAVAAAATNFHYKGDHHHLQSDIDADEENEEEEEGDHNTTVNISHNDTTVRQQLNGEERSVRGPRHHGSSNSVHNDKSDDSAIENSPSTSAASAGNGHISPVSTKASQSSKQTQQQHNASSSSATSAENITTLSSPPLVPFEALKLLSGMQFRVTRNGTNANGEQELVVNLELNGIKYSGILVAYNSDLPSSIATTSANATAIMTTSTTTMSLRDDNTTGSSKNENNCNSSSKTGKDSPININHNPTSSDDTNKAIAVVIDAMEEDTDEMPVRVTSPNTNNISNGASDNASSTLKDALITS